MNNEQALAVLKQVLDAAVSKSVFPTMDSAYQAASAFNIIAAALQEKQGEKLKVVE